MKTTTNNASVNVYQMVTDRMIEMLEKGVCPWHQPWTGAALEDGGAISYVTRRPYSFINQLLLGKPGEWLTFKQCKEQGGSIRKGAKAGLVVFFKQTAYKKEVENENGEKETRIAYYPLLKYYHVFHIDDCEGVKTKIKEVKGNESLQPVDECENIICGYLDREKGLTFVNNQVSGRAYYSPSKDMVVVPKINQYDIVEEYYSTTFHELTHSTMRASRCDREADNKMAAFGSEDYSREELVAELGAAMICNKAGLDNAKAFKNSVAYVKGWLKALKNDNKMIIWASSRAEKAARYIIGENEQ